MTNKKICRKCLKKKSLDQFKLRPNKKSYESYCYPCQIGYFKEYNAKRYATPEARAQELKRGNEKYKEIIKPARRKKKNKLIAIMGGRCIICGYSKNYAALDFDHINPTTKTRTISHLLAVSRPWAWNAAVKEAKKCQLLCANCHREKTFPDCTMTRVIDF
jgi:5-methylcytosine-specific restriction endonuclease McrA